MRITLGIENVNSYFYRILVEELAEYAPVEVTRGQNQEVIVKAEGNLVKCSCIVAVCDKYRNSGQIGLPDYEDA